MRSYETNKNHHPFPSSDKSVICSGGFCGGGLIKEISTVIRSPASFEVTREGLNSLLKDLPVYQNGVGKGLSITPGTLDKLGRDIMHNLGGKPFRASKTESIQLLREAGSIVQLKLEKAGISANSKDYQQALRASEAFMNQGMSGEYKAAHKLIKPTVVP